MQLAISGTIKAPIETTFKCLTDIRFFKKEFRRFDGGKEFKIQYDRKAPFGVNKKIFFIREKPEFVARVVENNGCDRLVLVFEPKAEYKALLGAFEYQANLTQLNDKTRFRFLYSSTKEPVGLFKAIAILAKLPMLFSLWGTKRRFVKFVLAKAA